MAMPPKFCPECRDEFIHAATVCSSCDVALVLEADLRPEEDEVDEMPPISELVCIRASAIGWAMALSQKLSEAGIPHRVQAADPDAGDGTRNRPGHNLPYGIFVFAQDAEAAQQIDVEHSESEIPDIPTELEEVAEGACPACGDPLDPTAAECPGCGIALL